MWTKQFHPSIHFLPSLALLVEGLLEPIHQYPNGEGAVTGQVIGPTHKCTICMSLGFIWTFHGTFDQETCHLKRPTVFLIQFLVSVSKKLRCNLEISLCFFADDAVWRAQKYLFYLNKSQQNAGAFSIFSF